MNRERYDQYLLDYIREALIYGDNDVGAAANWLMAQRTSRFFAREEQKEALQLAYFRGYTHRQIAETLDQPLGTVKTRIRLAMIKLRKILSDEEI